MAVPMLSSSPLNPRGNPSRCSCVARRTPTLPQVQSVSLEHPCLTGRHCPMCRSARSTAAPCASPPRAHWGACCAGGAGVARVSWCLSQTHGHESVHPGCFGASQKCMHMAQAGAPATPNNPHTNSVSAALSHDTDRLRAPLTQGCAASSPAPAAPTAGGCQLGTPALPGTPPPVQCQRSLIEDRDQPYWLGRWGKGVNGEGWAWDPATCAVVRQGFSRGAGNQASLSSTPY